MGVEEEIDKGAKRATVENTLSMTVNQTDHHHNPTQQHIVTNLINSRFEQFILRDEEETSNNVELISYTKHHKNKNNIIRKPNNNTINQSSSQKRTSASPRTTATTETTSQVNSSSTNNITLKSQTPTGPKGKRPPSKTYIQQKSSKGDVFDELNSRQIHNIGRVESIRG